MFGRSATFQLQSGKLNDFETRIPEMRDRLKSLDGLIDCYIAWDETGAGLTMVVYDTEDSADAALPTVRSIWEEFADYLEAPPALSNYPSAHKLSG